MNSRMGPRGAFLGSGQPQYTSAPNAALLIDFDNVTMSIRSDLGKELKALLKSDVIRGKVAVQRAYADWRRYPQYIVPLTESSVDLIFAPAYGSSKKNATDLRMAIDAIELVFTRPEIGTFILMTGDSDFSSCVLKLKEYGKYVIGVGMRESSSDLLIQNCDEYYSYHSLTGLTRATEVEESTEDPWVLVKRAVQQMVKNGDVMRTDRLKQVMLELDPAFDEKKIGYSKFSRFVSEAAAKGVLQLRKMENGQYEVVPDATEPAREPAREPREKVVERIVAEAEAGANGRRGRRGRGRERPLELVSGGTPESEPAAQEAAPRSEAPRRPEPVAAVAPAAEERRPLPAPSDLDSAYALLQEAVRRLSGGEAKAVRDGDIKRKMLELSKGFDETELGFSKFTRFLRQAHDAEVIDLHRVGAGNYEVTLPASGKRLPSPWALLGGAANGEGQREAAPAEAGRRDRRGREERREEGRPGKVQAEAAAAAAAEPEVPAPAVPAEPAREEAATSLAPATAAEPAAPSAAADTAPRLGVGVLRGRRVPRAPLAGPPPILPGQAIGAPRLPEVTPQPEPQEQRELAVASEEPAASEKPAAPETPAAEKPASRGGRGRRGRGRGRAAAEAASAALPEVAAKAAAEESPTGVAEATTPPTAAADAAQPLVVEVSAETAAAAPAREESKQKSTRSRRGRGRAKTAASSAAVGTEASGAEAAAAPAATAATSGEAAAESKPRGGGRAQAPAAKQGQKASESPRRVETTFSAERLGLPRELPEITTYLSTAYKGVGKKTAEALLERFGTDVFQVLHERPEEVKAVLDQRRANALLDQWREDFARREREAAAAAPAEGAAAEPAGEQSPGGGSGSRSRRGGRGGRSRGRGGSRKEPASAS